MARRRSTGINRSVARRNLKGRVLYYYHDAEPDRTPAGKAHYNELYRCYFCRGLFKFYDLTLEHLIPIVRGGSVRDLRNLEVACSKCNNKKGSLTIEEFMAKYGIPSYRFPRRGIKEEEV